MQIAGIVYGEERLKAQERYQGAVERATFLDDKERKHWAILGYILTTDQLKGAERLIIDEDLKRLNTRHQLEILKSNKESRHVG